MKSALARVLLNKGVIRQGTVVQAYRNVRGLSCVRNANVVSSFIISGARLLDGNRVIFESIDQDHATGRLPSEDIISLDGMLIERIATSHNLTLDGKELAARSRRGRRRKVTETPTFADTANL